jgi:hypothetical protein
MELTHYRKAVLDGFTTTSVHRVLRSSVVKLQTSTVSAVTL